MSDIVDVIRSLDLEVDILARALIVCGAAFVCSGLVFFLPGGRKKNVTRVSKKDIERNRVSQIRLQHRFVRDHEVCTATQIAAPATSTVTVIPAREAPRRASVS
jgi:hypothetical protein